MEQPNRIRQLRQHEGLSLEDLATDLGVSVPSLSRYERGERPVPDHHKLALSMRFEVTVAYLMRWPEDGNGGRKRGRRAT